MKRWKVEFASEAIKQLAAIKDNRIKHTIAKRIERLHYEPEKQGKPLEDELASYYTIRAAGQRYRIIYTLKEEQILVLVVMIGIRKEGDKKDAYAHAKRMARLGLLDQTK